MKVRPYLLILLTFGFLGSACSSREPEGPPCEEPRDPGGHWEPLLPAPAGGGWWLETAWTGDELLVWGRPEQRIDVDGEERRPSAAAYSPVTRMWRDITPYGSDLSDRRAVWPGTAWTGEEWIVWGGEEPRRSGGIVQSIEKGVRIDPTTGTWQPMSPAPIEGRSSPYAVWTGKEVLFWIGMREDLSIVTDGAAYNPSTDSWRLMGTEGLPAQMRWTLSPRGVWTGQRWVFWSMPEDDDVTAVQYDPEEDRWYPVALEGAPPGSHGSAWTGTELLAWTYTTENGYERGGAYDPLQDRWHRELSVVGAPAASGTVWAEGRMFAWGDYRNGCRVGGIYDVQTDTWSTFTSQGAPTLRYGHHLAWTGHSLLVYGGRGGHEGRFDQVVGGEFFPEP